MTEYAEKLMERERKRYLSIILGSYANTLAEQDIVKAMDNNPNTTTKDYVYALCDGLAYGNWPWINYSSEHLSKVALKNKNGMLNDILNACNHRYHDSICVKCGELE